MKIGECKRTSLLCRESSPLGLTFKSSTNEDPNCGRPCRKRARPGDRGADASDSPVDDERGAHGSYPKGPIYTRSNNYARGPGIVPEPAGLADHAGHDLAALQMKGFGGMLSLQLKGGRNSAMRVAARSKRLLAPRAATVPKV